ncbi:MAG: hypothetical protein WCA23_33590 [Stellaceae bacterium]
MSGQIAGMATPPPSPFAFEIARKDHKYVEVTYDLDAQRFDEVRRIVHIIFGVQG